MEVQDKAVALLLMECKKHPKVSPDLASLICFVDL